MHSIGHSLSTASATNGIVVGSAARAQCEPAWTVSHDMAGGVSAWHEWDGKVIAGGSFTSIGGVEAGRIASWNGSEWSPLAEGVYGAVNGAGPWVSDMVTYQKNLIAGGTFVSAGGVLANSIARWDGARWSPLGSGVSGGFSGGGIAVLAEFQGDLYVGGGFQFAGGRPAAYIARWDGSAWHGLDSQMDGTVTDMVVYEDSLVVVGGFWSGGGFPFVGGVIRWTGASWQFMGGYCVKCQQGPALVTNNQLYLGVFDMIGPRLVRWSGGGWIEVPNPGWRISSLAEYRGEMIATGTPAPLSTTQTGIARWTGSAWSPLGGGIPGSWGGAMGVSDDSLFVSGYWYLPGFVPFRARWGCACWADCNNDGVLTIADFGCFQTQFVHEHPYADCDADGSLTIADFGCFQTKYVQGCP